MIVWTVANQKGGVGKTTTTVALAGLLAEQGKRVLCIDTDPHASLTYYFGIDSESLESSSFDVFSAGKAVTADLIRRSILRTQFNNLSVMPATMALATLDRKLGTQYGAGTEARSGNGSR